MNQSEEDNMEFPDANADIRELELRGVPDMNEIMKWVGENQPVDKEKADKCVDIFAKKVFNAGTEEVEPPVELKVIVRWYDKLSLAFRRTWVRTFINLALSPYKGFKTLHREYFISDILTQGLCVTFEAQLISFMLGEMEGHKGVWFDIDVKQMGLDLFDISFRHDTRHLGYLRLTLQEWVAMKWCLVRYLKCRVYEEEAVHETL